MHAFLTDRYFVLGERLDSLGRWRKLFGSQELKLHHAYVEILRVVLKVTESNT